MAIYALARLAEPGEWRREIKSEFAFLAAAILDDVKRHRLIGFDELLGSFSVLFHHWNYIRARYFFHSTPVVETRQSH